MAALPAQAAGSGAELARPSAVQSAVKSAPSILEPSSVDQAVNSVVDAVKVTDQLLHVLPQYSVCRPNECPIAGSRRWCQKFGECSRQWAAVCTAGLVLSLAASCLSVAQLLFDDPN